MSTHTTPALSPDGPYALLGGADSRRGLKLYYTGLSLLGAALLYLGFTSKVTDPLQLFQGLAIFALSFVPGLLWAKSGGSRFPVFEPLMLLCASAYAMPLLSGQSELAVYAPEVITRTGWVVLLYQGVAIATYHLTKGRPGTGGFWNGELLSTQVSRFTLYGLSLSTVYIVITTFTDWVPPDIESVFHAIFFGLGILCTFVGTQRWGRGELNQTEKTILIASLVPQLILQTVSLMLIGSISLLGIALMGFLSGGKRVPWIPMVAAFAILAVLHNGKSQMRKKYWEELHPLPTFTQLPAFYAEWINFGLQPPADNADGESSAGRKLIERTSLMHMLCLIVNYTPDSQPYLYGETYGYVLPQLVPRLLWPDKPRSHIATYRLGIYYGLQDEDATNSTTIAFGMLAEAYANFGLVGSILLGAFWGVSLKKLQLLSQHSPMFSPAGLMMILLTAWSFNSELTMAAWISSLYQAMLVVVGLPVLVRRVFGD